MKTFKEWLLIIGIATVFCGVNYFLGFSKGNQSGQAKIQAKWDKEHLETAWNSLIYQIKVNALENQNNAFLAQKQEELEHEKQLSKNAALAANNQLDSLWNRIDALNGQLSKTPNCTSGTQTALAQSRELLGACAKRYTELGREADELRDRAALGKAYAETVIKFSNDIEKMNNIKDGLF